MPLVAITSRPEWHPTETTDLIYQLGSALPELLTYKGHELGLTAETPAAGVQVTFEKFDRLSINIPDVWILVVFTEDPAMLTSEQRLDVRDKVIGRITDYLREPTGTWLGQYAVFGKIRERRVKPAIAVDVFWGPGHGCILDQNGSTVIEW